MLPFAIVQLYAVGRDLSRITAVSDVERQLWELMERGTALLLKLRAPVVGTGVAAELYRQIEAGLVDEPNFQKWVEDAGELIRTNTNKTEEQFFLLAGIDAEPVQQLDAKLKWVRNDLMPKVRAGFWIESTSASDATPTTK